MEQAIILLCNPLSVFFIILGITVVVEKLAPVFPALLDRYAKMRSDELRVRKIEALVRMNDGDRKLLLDTMPDWLDRNDQEEIEGWRRARAEAVGAKNAQNDASG